MIDSTSDLVIFKNPLEDINTIHLEIQNFLYNVNFCNNSINFKKNVDDLYEIIGISSFNDFLNRNKNRNFTQVQYNITMEWNS
jgi:hypothetical protein